MASQVTKIPCETRVSLKALAVIVTYYHNLGSRGLTRGGSIGNAVEDFAALLVANNLVTEVSSNDEALETLASLLTTGVEEVVKNARRALAQQLKMSSSFGATSQPQGFSALPKSEIDSIMQAFNTKKEIE